MGDGASSVQSRSREEPLDGGGKEGREEWGGGRHRKEESSSTGIPRGEGELPGTFVCARWRWHVLADGELSPIDLPYPMSSEQ
jgi:hypothetical protein